MKKIGTITFHASYNYGSNLQAYALQEYIKKIFNNQCEYKIINLRTNKQKNIYMDVFKKKGIKNFIKKIFLFPYRKELTKKNEYFENFINENLQLTCEFENLEELNQYDFGYDYYISGSDQLWNSQAHDFDWANYLEFVSKGKKISYAASWGPKEQNWDIKQRERIKKNLLQYSNLSVRDYASFNNVEKLTNIKPEIHVDPTMLLNKSEWKNIVKSEKIINGKYIFLYNLKKDNNIIKLARKISKILNIPIVVSKPGNILETIYGFNKKYDVGPIEFLNLINNSELVLSSSFHGTIFSIIFNKPFFAINGSSDNRINTLLNKMGLENRSIDINDNVEEKCKGAFNISFDDAEKILEYERNRTKKYFEKSFEVL